MTSDPTFGSKPSKFQDHFAARRHSNPLSRARPVHTAGLRTIRSEFGSARRPRSNTSTGSVSALVNPRPGSTTPGSSDGTRPSPRPRLARAESRGAVCMTMLVCHTLRSSHVAAHAGAHRIGAGECLERAVTSADWTEGIALRDGGSYGPPPRSPSTRSARRRTRRVVGVIRQSWRGPVVAWLLGGGAPVGGRAVTVSSRRRVTQSR